MYKHTNFATVGDGVFGIFLGVATTRHGWQMLMTKIRGALGSNFNPSRTPETVSGNVNKPNSWDWETRPWSVSDALPGKNRAFLSRISQDTATKPVVFGQFPILPDSTQLESPGLCRSLQRVYSQSLKGVSPSASQGCEIQCSKLKRCIFEISHVIHVKCMYDIECA